MTVDYREKCFARKHRYCHICGSEEEIVVHHIIGNREDNSISNLLPVCEKCHKDIHSSNDKLVTWSDMLLPREERPYTKPHQRYYGPVQTRDDEILDVVVRYLDELIDIAEHPPKAPESNSGMHITCSFELQHWFKLVEDVLGIDTLTRSRIKTGSDGNRWGVRSIRDDRDAVPDSEYLFRISAEYRSNQMRITFTVSTHKNTSPANSETPFNQKPILQSWGPSSELPDYQAIVDDLKPFEVSNFYKVLYEG